MEQITKTNLGFKIVESKGRIMSITWLTKSGKPVKVNGNFTDKANANTRHRRQDKILGLLTIKNFSNTGKRKGAYCRVDSRTLLEARIDHKHYIVKD